MNNKPNHKHITEEDIEKAMQEIMSKKPKTRQVSVIALNKATYDAFNKAMIERVLPLKNKENE